jgi:hypothetical protein
LLVALATYLGLKLIRAFALQIARENHDAIVAMDQAEEELRLKKERAADAAAASAFAKVKPILTTSTSTTSSSNVAVASGNAAASAGAATDNAETVPLMREGPPDIATTASV